MEQLRFPFGPADVQSVTSAGTLALTVENGGLTYIKLSELPAAITALTVTVPDDMPDGALLFIEIPCGASAYNVTPSTGFTSAALTGTINKTKVASFVFVDGKFVNTGLQTIN